MGSIYVLLLIFVATFLIFLFSGWPIAFGLASASIIAYVVISGGSAFGNFVILTYRSMFNYNLLALPIFVFMGQILIKGGVVTKLYDSLLPLMERFTGSLIYTNIGANVILGACSGSTIAATTAISTIAIPELKKRGFSKFISYGSLASAGCIAAIIPPSIGMIIYCSITTVSLGKLFVAGIIPGLLLALCLAFVTYLWIKISPNIAPPIPKKIMPLLTAISYAFKNLWPLFILIFVVLGVIYFGIATAAESGCYGIFGAMIIAYFNKKLNLKMILTTALSTTKISAALLLIIAVASVYGYAINMLGFRQSMLIFLENLPEAIITKMFILWVILLFLGMFLDSASILIIITPIFLPFVTSIGMDPVWFGIFILLASELGNITPPVGLTLYAVQVVSKEPLDVIAKGCLPYWVSYFMAQALIIFFPILVLWLPSKLM